ncbi:ORF65 [Ranid herpesvirus 1]|uniref:ORF65 n=1 Tax=Ranid herpesvirus 1 TaxID=85655 RepID=Q14VP3_9VIRU|nr:ORF65 [Ranid herpesvirus 1]ABG25719.1 ORF65 [Ranid herpesvirus 1]
MHYTPPVLVRPAGHATPATTLGVLEFASSDPPFLDELEEVLKHTWSAVLPRHSPHVMFYILVIDKSVHYIHNDTPSGCVTATRLYINQSRGTLCLGPGRTIAHAAGTALHALGARFETPPCCGNAPYTYEFYIRDVTSYLAPPRDMWWEPAFPLRGAFATIRAENAPTMAIPIPSVRNTLRGALPRHDTAYRHDISVTEWHKLILCGSNDMLQPTVFRAVVEEVSENDRKAFTLPQSRVPSDKPTIEDQVLLSLSRVYSRRAAQRLPTQWGSFKMSTCAERDFFVCFEPHAQRSTVLRTPLLGDASLDRHTWRTALELPECTRLLLVRQRMRRTYTFHSFVNHCLLGSRICTPDDCIHWIAESEVTRVPGFYFCRRHVVLLGVFVGYSRALAGSCYTVCAASLESASIRATLNPAALLVVQHMPSHICGSGEVVTLLRALANCYTRHNMRDWVRDPNPKYHSYSRMAWAIVDILEGRPLSERFTRLPLTALFGRNPILIIRQLAAALWSNTPRQGRTLSDDELTNFFAAPISAFQHFRHVELFDQCALQWAKRTYAHRTILRQTTATWPPVLARFYAAVYDADTRWLPTSDLICQICRLTSKEIYQPYSDVLEVYQCGHYICSTCHNQITHSLCHYICPLCRQPSRREGCARKHCMEFATHYLLDIEGSLMFIDVDAK